MKYTSKAAGMKEGGRGWGSGGGLGSYSKLWSLRLLSVVKAENHLFLMHPSQSDPLLHQEILHVIFYLSQLGLMLKLQFQIDLIQIYKIT